MKYSKYSNKYIKHQQCNNKHTKHRQCSNNNHNLHTKHRHQIWLLRKEDKVKSFKCQFKQIPLTVKHVYYNKGNYSKDSNKYTKDHM